MRTLLSSCSCVVIGADTDMINRRERFDLPTTATLPVAVFVQADRGVLAAALLPRLHCSSVFSCPADTLQGHLLLSHMTEASSHFLFPLVSVPTMIRLGFRKE